MESVISLLKTVGTIKRATVEVCAHVDAAYDQAKGRLFISLDAFVRPVRSNGKNRLFRAAWLPERKHVTQDPARENAVDFANDVFRR